MGLALFDQEGFDLASELGDFSPQDVIFFLKGPIKDHPDVLSLRAATGMTDDEKLSEICSKVYENTKKYRGVVFALHKDIFADFEVHKGDDSDGDVYIHVPQGLTMKYISGLRLVGEGEKDYFEGVKENV